MIIKKVKTNMSLRDRLAHDYLTAYIASGRINLLNLLDAAYASVDNAFVLADLFIKEKQMTKETLIEVVKSLTGEIDPVGDSNIDGERFDNLKLMCELVNSLVTDIDAVNYQFHNSKMGTQKRAAEYASDFLTKSLGISE